MILFHGSNVEINKIDLTKCRPYKDFGKGFYLTAIEEQAFKMANRVSRIYGGTPCVTYYDFDDSVIKRKELSIRVFNKPTEKWALFVLNNRNRNFNDHISSESNLDFKYDIVIGPVADDDLALLFRQFTNNYIDLNKLVSEMEFKQLTSQYSFHSAKAIKFLTKVGTKYE